jgi:hypothetical protein
MTNAHKLLVGKCERIRSLEDLGIYEWNETNLKNGL